MVVAVVVGVVVAVVVVLVMVVVVVVVLVVVVVEVVVVDVFVVVGGGVVGVTTASELAKRNIQVCLRLERKCSWMVDAHGTHASLLPVPLLLPLTLLWLCICSLHSCLLLA